MRQAALFPTLALLSAAPIAAQPAHRIAFDIPAGPLRDSIVAIGSQGRITIGLTDPALGSIRVPRLRLRATVAEALDQLLADTPAMGVRIDATTFRIVRRPRLPSPPRPQASADTPGPVQTAEVVVRGSKRDTSLDDYPGSVAVVDTSTLPPEGLARGTEALVERLPILVSTHLGPGRDKLFIRGIADSSFAGRNQATVGEYLGDIRLNYSAPDPHLALYDLRAVEILEGPQGTLYGAGALGGIMRLEPNAPNLTETSGSAAAAIRLTQHGQAGGEAVGVVNLPLLSGNLGLRVVGYAGRSGGYIDDAQRDLRDVNRTDQLGYRATLRWQPGRWTLDLGLVQQDIYSRDGQYAERGLPDRTRTSAVAQPFDNDYLLRSVTIRRTFDQFQLTSATAFVRHDLTSTYDATVTPATPQLFRQNDRIRLMSNETRLSSVPGGAFDWILGVELLRSQERVDRYYGPVAAPLPQTGIDSIIEEASVFGEMTVRPWSWLALTAGGRGVIDRRKDDTFEDDAVEREPIRIDRSFLPTVGVLATPKTGLNLYARYQQGFRAGGLAVSDVATEQYESDAIATYDIGVRYRTGGRWSFSAAVSRAHWEDIQADLVTMAGFPFVTNIGSGRVTGLEADAEWRPAPATVLQASAFLNDSTLHDPEPEFADQRDVSLPNIPGFIGRVGVRQEVSLGGRTINLRGSARYVGRSRLGVGNLVEFRQGGYFDTSLGASVPIGRFTLTADATNLADAGNNIFALGNPFQLGGGRQITPQAPRAIRIGISRDF